MVADLASDSAAQRLNQRVSRVGTAVGADRYREAFVVDLDQRLRRVAIVVSQHSTEPFTAFDRACDMTNFESRVDDLGFESLVVSFSVIVGKVFANSASQGVLAEEDHTI